MAQKRAAPKRAATPKRSTARKQGIVPSLPNPVTAVVETGRRVGGAVGRGAGATARGAGAVAGAAARGVATPITEGPVGWWNDQARANERRRQESQRRAQLLGTTRSGPSQGPPLTQQSITTPLTTNRMIVSTFGPTNTPTRARTVYEAYERKNRGRRVR